MEKTTDIHGDLLEVNQTAILDYIYMEHHSKLHPFHHNFIDKSQRHWLLQNISEYEQRILLPCDERPTSAEEQVTYQNNRQSEAEGCHSEKIRNSIKKDLKETVGCVRRPLTDFNRRESFSKTESPFHVPNSQSEETLHTCEICNEIFSRKASLTTYRRSIHSDEKPFVCKKCGASFKHKSTLFYHDRMHKGDRPFVCKACEASFAQRSTLRTHERTHTGEKPYSCQKCSRKFSQSSHMRRHERICRNND